MCWQKHVLCFGMPPAAYRPAVHCLLDPGVQSCLVGLCSGVLDLKAKIRQAQRQPTGKSYVGAEENSRLDCPLCKLQSE